MKHSRLAATAALLVLISLAALAAVPADRPDGVIAKDWVPINDRLGIVLTSDGSPVEVPNNLSGQINPPGRPLVMLSPASGYFMVRSSGRWQRLYMLDRDGAAR